MNKVSGNTTGHVDFMLWVSVFYTYFEFYLRGQPSMSIAFCFWHGVVIALLAYMVGYEAAKSLGGKQ